MQPEGFASLTPDAVLDAVEAAGFEPSGHVSRLVCLENRVFDVRLEDGRHVVAKFYRPGRWSPAALREEHAFLADLATAEIPVCAPLELAGGGTLAKAGGFDYAVWPRTGGRAPDEFDDAQVEILGRLLARIHNVGAAGEARARPRLQGGAPVLAALDELASRHLPPACVDRYCDAAETLADHLDDVCAEVPLHRIHGDCHVGNLLRGDAGWFFLDFDDFVVGPAVHDVWMLLPGRDPEAARQRETLLVGYRQFRPFDPAWLHLVEPLRALRFVVYAAWLARRWRDPAFPDAFPHFGTDRYWETETRDLEAAVSHL